MDRPSVVVVACTARISYRQPRPVWTFDERQLSVLVVFKIVETLVFLRSDRRSRQSSFVRLVSAVGSPSAADTPIRRIFLQLIKSMVLLLGPTVYKNYAVSAGVQVPVYQAVGSIYPRERIRIAINFSYFF